MQSVSRARLACAAFLPALAGAQAAAAPPSAAAPAAALEVLVTADPLSGADDHPAQPVSVLAGRELERQSRRNLGELVGSQPGVTAGDFGPNVGRPIIRGLSGSRVRVLADGIGAMDVSTVSPDHALAIEPVFASQVEIFRGPSTLLFGSGASGGLVNVIDERIPEHLPERAGGELYAHYDTVADGRLGAIALETALGGHVAARLSVVGSDTADYAIPGFATRAPRDGERPGRLRNSDGDHDDITLGGSLVGARGFLGLAVQTLNRNYGVPGGHVHDHDHDHGDGHDHEDDDARLEPAAATHEGVRIDQAQTRVDLKGRLEAPLPGLESLRTRWGVNDHRHAEIEPDGTVATALVNEEWEGRIEAVHEPVLGLTGVIGLQLQGRDFDARGEEAFVPRSSQDSVAAFLLEQRDFGPFHLELGARYERNAASADDSRREVVRALRSFSGAAGWHYRPHAELGFAVTRAERAPSLEELFANGPHLATNTFEIGSPRLGRETSVNVDVYWRHAAPRWRASVNVFYNRIADFVHADFQDTDGDGAADRVAPDFADTGLVLDDPDALLLLRYTQADARLLGFEAEASVRLVDDARGLVEWRLFSDYVDGELDAGPRLPRMPPWRLGSGLDFERGPWRAGLAVTRVDAQHATAPLERPTDGHVLLDVYAEYLLMLPADVDLTLFARGSNLLDEDVRRHVSFVKDRVPLPGAAGVLGLRVRF